MESDWVWWGSQQKRDNLEDLSVDNSIKMNHEYILRGCGWTNVDQNMENCRVVVKAVIEP